MVAGNKEEVNEHCPPGEEGALPPSPNNHHGFGATAGKYMLSLFCWAAVLLGMLFWHLNGGFPSLLVPFIPLAIAATLLDLRRASLQLTDSGKPQSCNRTTLCRSFLWYLGLSLLLVVPFFDMLSSGWVGLLGDFIPSKAIHAVIGQVEYPLSGAHSVVVDSEGRIVVYSGFPSFRIQFYSQGGRFLEGWTRLETGPDEHVAIDTEDNLYFCGKSYVKVYTLRGQFVRSFDLDPNRRWTIAGNGHVTTEDRPIPIEKFSRTLSAGSPLPRSRLDFEWKDRALYGPRNRFGLVKAIEVQNMDGGTVDYIYPNPVSSLFSYVFPGILWIAVGLLLVFFANNFGLAGEVEQMNAFAQEDSTS